jgi:hypothetical protein
LSDSDTDIIKNILPGQVEAVSNPHFSNTGFSKHQPHVFHLSGEKPSSSFLSDLHCIKWGYETPSSALLMIDCSIQAPVT